MARPSVGKQRSVEIIYDEVYVQSKDVTSQLLALLDQLKIDPNNLSEEAEDQPALFARFAVMAEEASAMARSAKRRLELAKADVDGIIRKQSQEDGGKKPTEAQIENMVLQDEEIQTLTEELLDAERSAGIISALRQSLRDRRDMIIELMRDRRQESAAYGSND